jgi:hypothetical protein
MEELEAAPNGGQVWRLPIAGGGWMMTALFRPTPGRLEKT